MGLWDRLNSLDTRVLDQPPADGPTNGHRAAMAGICLPVGVVGIAAAVAGDGASRLMYGTFGVLCLILMLVLLAQIVRQR